MTRNPGDPVTLKTESIESDAYSNVFVFRGIAEPSKECILEHPFFPKVKILVPEKALDVEAPRPYSPIERAIRFVSRNTNAFSRSDVSIFEAICAYFIVSRRLSSSQLKHISRLLEQLASARLQWDYDRALNLVVQNRALLDLWNQAWFERLKNVFEKKQAPTVEERKIVFRQAGFILAQLEETSISQEGLELHERN